MSAEERLSAEERSDLLREVATGLTEGSDLLKDFWEAFRSSDAEWAAAKPELEQRLRWFQGLKP